MEYTHANHTFGPIYNQNSKILILGSFPSVKSREQSFYYGHPQNRFWKVLAGITGEVVPGSIEEKKDFLLRNGIALWDVIESCDIVGSSDSSIRNVVPNDMEVILEDARIGAIFVNGEKGYQLFRKYCTAPDRIPVVKLPSTSPANAAFQLERLIHIWGTEIGEYIS